jgi:hypothetical protein
MNKVFDIIESLYPDFKEYADNAQFHYWMEYACELDEVVNVVYIEDDKLIAYLNKRMSMLSSSKPEHHACTDVASTLEESIPSKFKGVFTYE